MLACMSQTHVLTCRSWAVKCNVVHYSWGALMINQYEGHESKLGGLTVLSYFGKHQPALPQQPVAISTACQCRCLFEDSALQVSGSSVSSSTRVA